MGSPFEACLKSSLKIIIIIGLKYGDCLSHCAPFSFSNIYSISSSSAATEELD